MASYNSEELETPSVLAGIAKDRMETSRFPNSSSLKAHKVLPRSRVCSDEAKNTLSKPLVTNSPKHKTYPPGALSSHIQSWIPEPPQFEEGTLQHFPLTPPPFNRAEEMQNPLDSTNLAKSVVLITHPSQSSGLNTPVNQRSPPTPEITPPRRRAQDPNTVLHTTPCLSSPRADSFRTAREQFSSDDDRLNTPPRNESSSQQELLTHLGAQEEAREIGLGLNLDTNDTTILPKHMLEETGGNTMFSTFDGNWDNSTVEEVNDNSSSATELGPQHSKRLRPNHLAEQIYDAPTERGPLPTTDDISTHPYRGLSLRERVQKSRHSPPTASTERFAQQIAWPEDLDTKMRQMDNRRLSQMSAASTIVSAVVVDTPPQRQPTLRRTGKNDSLRTMSFASKESYRSSFPSDNPLHRLVHHNNRIIDRDHRSSTASDSVAVLRQISSAVVPARRSSLKSSDKNRRSKCLSQTSGPRQSSRPATAPDGAIGNQNFFTDRSLTGSSSLGSSTAVKSRGILSRELPPMIPTRSSSLSAPTSRNASRTTSLTSRSLHAHNTHQESQISQPQPLFQLTPDEDHGSESIPQSNIEDSSALRPRSTLATPFSTASMQSSTPGTLEVNEATAVNIYPHNNKSILVVQQVARRNSQQPPETYATIVEAANFTLTEPLTETFPQAPNRPKHLVDSPLRHPRPPPQPPTHPPAFTIIPPTPVPPINSADPPTTTEPGSTGPLASLKRALSSRRRNSDSFITPLTRSLSKRNSLLPRRPRLSIDYTSNKLSPFWRPRGFWDDLSDSESDFGNAGVLGNQSTRGRPDQGYMQNSRRSSLSHRLGSLRLRRRSRSGTGAEGIARRHSSESLRSYAFEQADREDGNGVPRFGYQVSFIGFKGLKEGFERRKVKREEGRRERERAKLRRSIGSMFVVPDARVA